MGLGDLPFLKFGRNDIARPWVPLTIVNPGSRKQVDIYGLVDTGADECALPATYASLLGFDLQQGVPKNINTGNGVTCAYAHTVQIKIEGLKTRKILIDFLPNLQVPLLGMKNFLANFILTIDYPQSKFSLQKH
ncbi:MAG TPA: retropepsin-like aspartic protease [bacterium]|nr:retropepsin-like aspartic protease [bacterium]